MSKLKILCAASALALTAGMASAATVEVTGITSQWISWTGGGSTVSTSPPGADPATLRWGTQMNDQKRQSGYDFDAVDATAAAPVTAEENVEFKLGDFTHLNWTINTATGIKSATLEVTFDLLLAGGVTDTLTSKFLFEHWETPNDDKPCADGGQKGQGVNKNGCADRVIVSTLPLGDDGIIELENENGDTFKYTFDILGFKQNGQTVNTFWTKESADNKASLYARFTYAENINTGPSPVPVPAAGFLLLGGLAALGAAVRRRKAA